MAEKKKMDRYDSLGLLAVVYVFSGILFLAAFGIMKYIVGDIVATFGLTVYHIAALSFGIPLVLTVLLWKIWVRKRFNVSFR
ncbi:hypothetical protein [Desulfovibrio ferrophilus]|uniref:Putative iron ABC transporter permease component n=1 Tax=Desulfovibrio ferrophilus TaxID=241368 RepID=A0A2Z6B3P4_9BACT|nr:hypothetical protein [Desulfovibrio ferrophilus]BBD10127.1 putative iron ABC transporter permease component [Desulfovibrio ferrophilus]